MRQLKPRQTSELVVAKVDGSMPAVVFETTDLIEAPNWTPDGRWLIYNAKGRLYRISPDGAKGPTLIDSGPLDDLNNDHLISPDGVWIYVSADDGHLYRISTAGGSPTRVSDDHGPDRDFRYFLHGISPDGGTLAYVGLEIIAGDVSTRICTIPAAGGEDRVLTDGTCPVDGPEYSPDGQWIYFNSEAAAKKPGHAQVFRMRCDGQGLEQLTDDARVNWFPHLSANGKHMVYLSYPTGTIGHPPDHAVIIRLTAPDSSGFTQDIDAFNGGQGTINVASWAPNSQAFAYVRYPFDA